MAARAMIVHGGKTAGAGTAVETGDAAGTAARPDIPAFDDHTLRYWLANEDWDMSQYTRRWLERTPPAEAADILANIAEGAQPEPSSLLYRMVLVVALSGFANSVAGVAERKAGVRAALMLARLGDRRAVAPLARVFDPFGSWQSKYQRGIESALAALFADAARRDDMGDAFLFAADARTVIGRTWPAGAGGGRRDLTPSLTSVMLAAIHCLHVAATAGDRESAEALRALAATAPASDPARHPNRARVQREAAALLDASPCLNGPVS